LLRPGQDFGQRLIPVTRQPSRVWYRVHRSAVPVVDFGLQPFHRFPHDRCPHRILYLGASSRFVDQPCLALFDREGLAGQLKAGRLGDLVDLDTTVDWLHDRKAALVF